MNLWHFEYSFDLDADNRMLYGKVYGVWKIETAEAYIEELKETVKPLIKKPWAKLVDLTNWKTVYPEAIEMIGEMNSWCRDNNMEWTVYIINQPAGYNQLMRIFDSGKNRDVSKTFRTLREGEQFLIDQGYTIRKDSDSIFK